MFIRKLLFLYLLLFGTLLNAQRLKSSNGSTIGYIENGRVKSSNGSRWTKMQQKNRNQLKYSELRSFFAETEGFEPSKQFPVYTLSKRAPSATRTSLL
jgi:hypothetical protein